LSPTLKVFTAEPASVTVPVNSWPMMKPLPPSSSPRYAWSSLAQSKVYEFVPALYKHGRSV
jgi:hypothetical protein